MATPPSSGEYKLSQSMRPFPILSSVSTVYASLSLCPFSIVSFLTVCVETDGMCCVLN